MYRIDVPSEINKLIEIFQYVGFWSVKDRTPCTKRVQLFHLCYFACLPISLGAGAVINTEESVYLAAVAIEAAVHVGRLFYIMRRTSEIIAFIHQSGPFLIEDHEEFNDVNNKVKNFIKYAKAFMVTIFITTNVTFFYYAFVGEKKLLFNIGFPLDWKNSEVAYWITYVYLAFQVIYADTIVGVTIIIWYLMLSFAIKYHLLGNKFRRLGIIKTTLTKGVKMCDSKKQHLFHQDLIMEIKTYKKIRE